MEEREKLIEIKNLQIGAKAIAGYKSNGTGYMKNYVNIVKKPFEKEDLH